MTELNSWSVVLGSLQRKGLSPGAEEVGVTALQLPRAYNHYSQGSDLALLQLAHPTAHMPLCLPQPGHRFPFGTSCWATGWDQDTNDGKCCPRLKPKEAYSLSCQLSLLPGSLAPQSPDSGPNPLSFASSQDSTESAPASNQPPHMQLSLQSAAPAAAGQPCPARDAVWGCPAWGAGALSGLTGRREEESRRGGGLALGWILDPQDGQKGCRKCLPRAGQLRYLSLTPLPALGRFWGSRAVPRA